MQTEKYKQCVEDIWKIILEFAKQDIITFPDFPPKQNYKLIQEQCSEPILDIAKRIKELDK